MSSGDPVNGFVTCVSSIREQRELIVSAPSLPPLVGHVVSARIISGTKPAVLYRESNDRKTLVRVIPPPEHLLYEHHRQSLK